MERYWNLIHAVLLKLLHIIGWLILFPFRLVAVAHGLLALGALHISRLEKLYIYTIIKNIISNFFTATNDEFEKQRLKHIHVCGMTGAGKSSLIECLINGNIRRKQGFLLIEPHAELADRVLHNKHFALGHASKSYKNLRVFDFEKSRPSALNIFKLPLPKNSVNKQQFIEGLSADIADAFAANMQPEPNEAMLAMLRNLLTISFFYPQANLMTLVDFLSSESRWHEQLQNTVDKINSAALNRYYRDEFHSPLARKTKEALRIRLLNFLSSQAMCRAFCADTCEINFSDILENNHFAIVKASGAVLGSYQSKTISSLILNLLNKYAFLRIIEDKGKAPFYVYIDEVQYYLTKSLEESVVGLRKTGISFTLAQQHFHQVGISQNKQKTLVNESGVKIYGQLQWEDQKVAHAIIHTDNKDDFEKLIAGEFWVKVGSKKAVKTHFPHKFSIKKEAFGKSWFGNAYMKHRQYDSLIRHLAPPNKPNYHYSVVQQPIPLTHKRKSNFSLHGVPPPT